MISLSTALTMVFINLVFYIGLLIQSMISRNVLVKNTSNKLISKLRTDYSINIKTFQKNNNHLGFAWVKTIYLNEKLFKKEIALKFAFFHELYHIKHNHKIKSLTIRFIFPLSWMLLALVQWYISIPIICSLAYGMFLITDNTNNGNNVSYFDRKANDYANEMIKNESTIDTAKGTNNSSRV